MAASHLKALSAAQQGNGTEQEANMAPTTTFRGGLECCHRMPPQMHSRTLQVVQHMFLTLVCAKLNICFMFTGYLYAMTRNMSFYTVNANTLVRHYGVLSAGAQHCLLGFAGVPRQLFGKNTAISGAIPVLVRASYFSLQTLLNIPFVRPDLKRCGTKPKVNISAYICICSISLSQVGALAPVK